jgi:molybdopterin converting factor small subunit
MPQLREEDMTLHLTVRLYGRYRDAAGSDTITLTLTAGNTIQDALDAFTSQYPAFVKDARSMMVTKNGTLTSHTAPLRPDDHLAIAPPVVSGG